MAFGYDGDGRRLWKREYLPRPLGVVVRLTLYAGYGFEEGFVEELVPHEAGEMVVPGDVCGKVVGVTERGFTGQRQEIRFGLYDYNARYLSPALGRFVSPDTIVPDFTNPQDLNRYSYVRNNPLAYIDPSGHDPWWLQDPWRRTTDQYDEVGASFGDAYHAAEQARVGSYYGSAPPLQTTPHSIPIPWSPERQQEAMETAIGVVCELCDWAMTFNRWRQGDFSGWDLVGLLPAASSGLSRRLGQATTDKLAARLRGIPCSFSPDTPVSTSKGLKPFLHLTADELALTFNEENGQLEYRPILAIWSHLDEVIVQVTLDNGEVIETTPEHPFMLRGDQWVEAGVLKVGDEVRQAGGYGVVETVKVIAAQREMYNLSVAETHTYFVGQGQWLVHNDCIKEQTELFEEYAASYSNIPPGTVACTLCAAKAGLDPKYAGQSRALLYYPDRGHAVLGVGDSLNNMIIVDISPFARVMGGTNVPIAEYNAKMGYPEFYPTAATERSILQVISGRKQ